MLNIVGHFNASNILSLYICTLIIFLSIDRVSRTVYCKGKVIIITLITIIYNHCYYFRTFSNHFMALTWKK